MKMPKGFKDIQAQIDFTKEEVDIGELPACAGCIETALRIMQEMAEALDAGLKYEDCPKDKDCYIAGHKEMRAALKRFKDWK